MTTHSVLVRPDPGDRRARLPVAAAWLGFAVVMTLGLSAAGRFAVVGSAAIALLVVWVWVRRYYRVARLELRGSRLHAQGWGGPRSWDVAQLGPLTTFACTGGPLPGVWMAWATTSGERIFFARSDLWPLEGVRAVGVAAGSECVHFEGVSSFRAARELGADVPRWYLDFYKVSAALGTALIVGGVAVQQLIFR